MNTHIIGIAIGGILGFICYIATGNILLSAIVILITILFFSLYVSKTIKKTSVKTKRLHSCYIFINNFIIALSIKRALKPAFDSASQSLDEEFDELVEQIIELPEEEKLKYLSKYFKFNIYSLFLDLLNIWSDQGGDIISMSGNLTNKLREIEEYVSECEQMHNKKIVEFVILWAFALAILVFLRFSLSHFFGKIINQIGYQLGVVGILLFVLVSIFILLSKITKYEIEGWKDD